MFAIKRIAPLTSHFVMLVCGWVICQQVIAQRPAPTTNHFAGWSWVLPEKIERDFRRVREWPLRVQIVMTSQGSPCRYDEPVITLYREQRQIIASGPLHPRLLDFLQPQGARLSLRPLKESEQFVACRERRVRYGG